MHAGAAFNVLRFFHVVGGVLWVGAAVFLALLLNPAVRAAGPAGGAVMAQIIQGRRLPLYMMLTAVITILSGLGLYGQATNGFAGAWVHSGPGITFGLGAVVAIAGALVGTAGSAPAAKRIAVLSSAVAARGGPPTADEAAAISQLQARIGSSAVWAAILLLLATAAMAVARYVP